MYEVLTLNKIAKCGLDNLDKDLFTVTDELKNPDLWDRLFNLTNMHEVTFVWVKGHNGHDYNERCDTLATAYADSL